MDMEKVTIMVSFMALCFSAVGIMLALANAGISQREGRIRLIAEKLIENGLGNIEEQRVFYDLMLGKKSELAEYSSPYNRNMIKLMKDLQRQSNSISLLFIASLIAILLSVFAFLIRAF